MSEPTVMTHLSLLPGSFPGSGGGALPPPPLDPPLPPPDFGAGGGDVVFCGTPEEMLSDGRHCHTARFLRQHLRLEPTTGASAAG